MVQRQKSHFFVAAPLTLLFGGVCFIYMLLVTFTSEAGVLRYYFQAPVWSQFHVTYWGFYFKLISHVVGHADWGHFLSNMTLLLLLGRHVEMHYGKTVMLVLIVITAALTSIVNMILFSGSLIGASGIVFLFIAMSAFHNKELGRIPIEGVLVVLIYLGSQIYQGTFGDDNTAQFAHITGCLVGVTYCLLRHRKMRT